MVSMVEDDRGISVIETAIWLPLILLIVVAGFQIWKLMMVERALHVGAYQAARYLANYDEMFTRANNAGYAEFIREQASVFVRNELEATGFGNSLKWDDPNVAFRYAPNACTTRWGGRRVTVWATLDIQAPVAWLEPLYTWPIPLTGSCEYDPCKN